MHEHWQLASSWSSLLEELGEGGRFLEPRWAGWGLWEEEGWAAGPAVGATMWRGGGNRRPGDEADRDRLLR